jgi:shikimate dehydrogenase
MHRLAVIGHPVGHSRSPAMHTAAFAALGIGGEWSYEAIDLVPQRFAAGVGELRDRGFAGVNVTIPHKRAAYELADRRSVAVTEIGAANTLSFGVDGIGADNTDASGLIAALPAGFRPAGTRALILGAGGSARACAWALSRAGADVAIANRTRERAEALAAELGVGVLSAPDPGGTLDLAGIALLVNATSVGLATEGAEPIAAGEQLKALGLRADQLVDPLIVVDLVYGSEPTELAATCMSGGATFVDGLEVLVRQGAESLRIWTGLEPPTEAMRDAVRQQQSRR